MYIKVRHETCSSIRTQKKKRVDCDKISKNHRTKKHLTIETHISWFKGIKQKNQCILEQNIPSHEIFNVTRCSYCWIGKISKFWIQRSLRYSWFNKERLRQRR